jgi:hypothetical protein
MDNVRMVIDYFLQLEVPSTELDDVIELQIYHRSYTQIPKKSQLS